MLTESKLHDAVAAFNKTVKDLKALEAEKARLSDIIIAHVQETGNTDLSFDDGVKASYVRASLPSVKVDEKLFVMKAKDYMSAADYEKVSLECLKETKGRKAYIR